MKGVFPFMKTNIVEISPKQLASGQAEEQLQLVADYLCSGQIVAFPTETVYGLGANALDEQAVQGIFAAKGRPSDNPLIVHISDVKDIDKVADLSKFTPIISKRLQLLADKFWPGPLTCIIPASKQLAENVTAGLDTVGVRIPDHPVALAILQTVNLPVAAPSANTSGKPSPTSAEHVYHDLNGRIPLIVDGGETGLGVESTVIDLTSMIPTVLRPGGISIEQLNDVLGQVIIDPAIAYASIGQLQPKSPGMKYTHYAPEGELLVFFRDSIHRVLETINDLPLDKRLGLICSNDSYHIFFEQANIEWSYLQLHQARAEEIARQLYKWLREVDKLGIELIFIEAIAADGVGYAVMNRMIKAAGGKVI